MFQLHHTNNLVLLVSCCVGHDILMIHVKMHKNILMHNYKTVFYTGNKKCTDLVHWKESEQAS